MLFGNSFKLFEGLEVILVPVALLSRRKLSGDWDTGKLNPTHRFL